MAQVPDKYIDLTGFMFARKTDGRTRWWKITGPVHLAFMSNTRYSYPVILCNVNGREFKETNSFSADFVLQCRDDGVLVKAPTNTKVSTAGEAAGAAKRRIRHLENKIESYTAELAALKASLGIE